MKKKNPIVVYWDASAILSALFKDSGSKEALKWARKEGVHLISTLAFAEVWAVIQRIHREGQMPDVLISNAMETFENGPWRGLNILPCRETIKNISLKWPLRGADLWHLATAKNLSEKIPELIFLTFDNRLQVSADGEGMTTLLKF